ncbi:hypothetical protein EJ02DRAFT_467252 [Clathrospora elynae]|uniref:Uncharacterized protein n=1 Tax=Clathrospora elynae TaxID=706981 RepID=A0A6A5SLS5_9PLEO|nr:hypothetical protein EJ02DRAFT_467252 [Clathrospora elynae]
MSQINRYAISAFLILYLPHALCEFFYESHRKAGYQSLFGGGNILTAHADGVRNLFSPATTTDNTSTASANNVSKNVPVGGIRYHVASEVLKLASSTLEKALSGDWAESTRKADGRYYIVFEEWDEQALLMLLNIIHL